MTGLLYQQGAPLLTSATPDSSAARTPPEVACAMQRLLAGKGIDCEFNGDAACAFEHRHPDAILHLSAADGAWLPRPPRWRLAAQ